MTVEPATDGPWEHITPQRVVELMRDATFRWWIAGAWALDLHLGHETRAHNDVEIAVLREDVDKARAQLRTLAHFVAHDGKLTRLTAKEPFPAHAHQVWSRERGHEAWLLEIVVEERDGDRWTYRRDPVIGAHVNDIGRTTRDGIPYIRPDIQLLYKSVGTRPVDDSDLIQVLPHLDAAQKATLAAWIGKADPTHRWLARLV